MQSIQRKILKLVITIALFSSVAFADGEMGGGGLWANESGPTKTVVTTSNAGQANDGNVVANSDSEFGLDWLMTSIAELLGMDD